MHRLNKAYALILHQKTNGCTMCATTKAMIKLLGRTHRKRGRFFVVEGTTGGVIRTRFFQWHTFINHIDDINAVNKLLYKGIWNHKGKYMPKIKKGAYSSLFKQLKN
jgi:hypothetical protein